MEANCRHGTKFFFQTTTLVKLSILAQCINLISFLYLFKLFYSMHLPYLV